jgi:tyrosine-protein phosphatase YwqE
MGSKSDMERICELGCDLQVNILSLAGYYGSSIAKWAKTLVEAGMVSYLGTDMHHTGHLKALEDALKHKDILRLLQRYSFKNKDFFNE